MSLIAEAAAPAWPALAARPRTFDRAALAGLSLVRDPGAQLLSVQLLGRLRVRLDDTPVDVWPSGRGRSLFKYLVTHRDPWPRREQLMDAFWPEAAPAAARNSLNVAVHGLRRAFRDTARGPVVVLEDGTYRLGPQLRSRSRRRPSTSGPWPSIRATSWPTTPMRSGRPSPASTCCSTTWTCSTGSAPSGSTATSTGPAWPCAACWSTATPAARTATAG